MHLKTIKNHLHSKHIFFSEDKLLGQTTVIGYDKQFRWSWLLTQLNTFYIASNLRDTKFTIDSTYSTQYFV